VKSSTGSFGPFGGVFAALPPFPGKFKLIDLAAAVSCQFGLPQRESSPWPGTRFYVDLRDRVQRQMWCGSYEPHVTRCLAALLRPGDTFIDVGAHIGYLSSHAAWVVGPKGQVFSFEPDPEVFHRLQKNLSCYPHALATQAAVWATDTVLDFAASTVPSELGWGSVTAVHDRDEGRHISVQSLSLDGFKERNSLSSIRAIKIDAEGSEPAILQGAKTILREFRPLLFIEFHNFLLLRAGSSSERLRAILAEKGYAVFNLRAFRLESLQSMAKVEFADCLCIPAEISREVLSELKSCGFSLG
jgi:FkbM family methyltransferase